MSFIIIKNGKIVSGQLNQQQSDWNESNTSNVSFIKNKPNIPSLISDLSNDVGFITIEDIPLFSPSNYDLNQFNNNSLDPFARISDISSGNTNLSYEASPTQGTVISDTGNDAIIPLADNTNAGLFSSTEKNKLAGIADGAEVNVNADWNATSGDAQILNKPTIPDVSGFVPYTGATTDVDLGEHQLKAGQLEFDQTPTGTPGAGKLRWNDTDGTLDIGLKGGNVTLQVGQEQVARVVNKTSPLIDLLEANYQVVKVVGATGQRLSVALAQADSSLNSAVTLGVVTETINANQEGFVTTGGQVREINTTGSLQGETWSDGDVLYLSPTTAGALTKVRPSAPDKAVVVGFVEYAHANHGKIYVKIDAGITVDELDNVTAPTPSNNDVLSYNSSTGIWENKTVVQALGYTPIQEEDWVNYSSLSTISGFSTLNTVVIKYLKIGKAYLYYFFISGVSNAANFTFTIHTVHLGNTYFTAGGLTRNGNNLSNNPPRITITSNSSTISLLANLTGSTWTAASIKEASGWFVVESN